MSVSFGAAICVAASRQTYAFHLALRTPCLRTFEHMIRSEQERQRIASVDALRARGIEPYPAAAFPVTHRSASLKADFQEGVPVNLAGRLMSRRIMGKASFAELQDSEGTLQIYLNRDELCPGEDKSTYNEVFKKLLEVVLTFGNFLNQGSFRGNAQAVKVNFLGELKSTKANPGKRSISNYNMLHYLNEYLAKEDAPKVRTTPTS